DSGGEEKNKVIYVIASQEKETSMNLDELRVKNPEDLSGQEYKFLADNKAELSAADQERFGLQATAETKDDKKEPVQASSLKGDEGVVSIEASEIKGMQDTIKSLQ